MGILLLFLAPLLAAQPFDLAKAITAPQDYGFVLEQPAIDFWTKRIPTVELTPHAELGFSNVSSTNVRSIAVGKQRLIWDVVYRFDQHGRRISAVAPAGLAQRSIIFSGCSFIFGTGLAEGETVPDLLAKALPKVRVYNAAIGASGTNQMLALIQTKAFEAMFPEKESLFVYVYIKDHVMRANGLHPMLGWMKKTPHFEWENGQLVSKGTIEQQHRWRTLFYQWAGKLFYRHTYFPELTKDHYDYACNLVSEARRRYEARGPGHRFVVVEHPLASDDRFATCLKEKDIPVLRFTHARSESDIIRGEGHPSLTFNQAWAKKLLPLLSGELR